MVSNVTYAISPFFQVPVRAFLCGSVWEAGGGGEDQQPQFHNKHERISATLNHTHSSKTHVVAHYYNLLYAAHMALHSFTAAAEAAAATC